MEIKVVDKEAETYYTQIGLSRKRAYELMLAVDEVLLEAIEVEEVSEIASKVSSMFTVGEMLSKIAESCNSASEIAFATFKFGEWYDQLIGIPSNPMQMARLINKDPVEHLGELRDEIIEVISVS